MLLNMPAQASPLRTPSRPAAGGGPCARRVRARQAQRRPVERHTRRPGLAARPKPANPATAASAARVRQPTAEDSVEPVGLRASHLRHRPAAPVAGAHVAARPGQPGQRRLRLAGGRRRPDPDELSRGQPGGARAAALPAQLPDRRRRHRRAAADRVRRRARPRARAHGHAAGRRSPAAACSSSVLPRRGVGAGRAHLLAWQSARRRLRGGRGHVQRHGRAQLPAADPVLGLAQPRHERRARARRQAATSSASTWRRGATASRSASWYRPSSRWR